jgi:hypothetical protein
MAMTNRAWQDGFVAMASVERCVPGRYCFPCDGGRRRRVALWAKGRGQVWRVPIQVLRRFRRSAADVKLLAFARAAER